MKKLIKNFKQDHWSLKIKETEDSIILVKNNGDDYVVEKNEKGKNLCIEEIIKFLNNIIDN